MKRLLLGLRRFATSLAGRIALILAIGISCAAIGALFVADQVRQADYQRWRSEQVVLSAADVANRLARDRAGTIALLEARGLVGVKLLPAGLAFPASPDATLTEMVRARAPANLQIAVLDVTPAVCMSNDPFWKRPRVAGFKFPITPECWLMTATGQGETLRITIDLPRLARPPSPITQPLFLVLIIAASTLLSILVASLATAPIRRLAAASRAFARSIDADPVAESGPEDVRQALATFNTMQDRVREGLRERTRLLAAISHDLQTPLTRLRLRLEQVEDDALRERLVTDLSATLAMVRRGLDLARASESAEQWSVIDLDSMLAAMVEDAAEFGHAVRFAGGCGARVQGRPDALSRCLGNVIDNAIRYAGGAEVACRRDDGATIVSVRDHGPGMPEALIAHAFEPFVRGQGQEGTLGTGIGLTIAQAQARATDGELTIRNHPEGGLLVELRLTR
ncbi:ATP-binding protein [Sphingomonas sp. HITSZ_GF]|uniref:ATP-binding protein n=1 Tax=Sphingomonas sp. HITSZ_GF TaxID=3037247 RepID=UPI00240DCF0B|nr:ATP-binding protein [Sphingomonas sp. HITSZ_GF]MDG2535359.1 ATP-binding protein [Sphingomonas sp. HITSZ_GF]